MMGTNNMWAHLRIESVGESGVFYKVWLNGHEISDCVSSLTLDVAAGKLGLATLSIFVGKLDLDARTAMLLRADVESQAVTKALADR
jgi:hypothetical protein